MIAGGQAIRVAASGPKPILSPSMVALPLKLLHPPLPATAPSAAISIVLCRLSMTPPLRIDFGQPLAYRGRLCGRLVHGALDHDLRLERSVDSDGRGGREPHLAVDQDAGLEPIGAAAPELPVLETQAIGNGQSAAGSHRREGDCALGRIGERHVDEAYLQDGMIGRATRSRYVTVP